MPWKETTIMSLRKEIIQLVSKENRNMSELCRQYGISRKTGYKWLRRYQEEGQTGLEDRSRRPHHSPDRTAEEIEKKVLKVREAHPEWGGRKIKAYLEQRGQKNIPAISTITAILHRYNKIDPEESQKHQAYQRFEMEHPNQLLQIDFKGYFSMERGGYCHPLTVLDDHSRFLLGLQACANETRKTVQEQLTDIFRQYGIPDRMLMDNGSPWGYDGDTRHTVFTAWLIRLGIKVSHGRPYHPQTQGKCERLHRTLKYELLRRYSMPDLQSCQASFDSWRDMYNHERPHEALDMLPPASRYQPSMRPFPEHLPPIQYGPQDIIRKVDVNGKIYFKNRVFRVGKAFRRQPVALRPTFTDSVFDVYFCSENVAQIVLKTVEP